MLWKTPSADDVVDIERGLLPELAEGDPPRLPPFVEHEWQPPRKGSNLIYKRLKLPDGVQVSVMAKPGRSIDEVIRFEPASGGDPVIRIITRRVPGRPTKQQTNGAADHAAE